MVLVIAKVILISVSIFAAATTQAQEVAGTFGIGVWNSAKNSLSETKLASVTFTKPLGPLTNYYVETGGWIDRRKDLGREGSGYIGGGVGARVDTVMGLYLGTRIGVNVVNNPDVMLGGPIQFSEELSLGLRGTAGARMGFGLKHFSSAGLYKKNMGRDFINFSIIIPLGEDEK